MVLKLYHSAISPACRAVKLAVSALNLQVEYAELDLLSKKYLQTELPELNPQHTVPTLVDDNAVIWDSHAINIYLVQKYAPDYMLFPADPLKRAVINQRLHFDSSVLYPCVYNCVVPILFRHMTNLGSQQIAAVKQVYGFLDKFLDRSEWIADDKITVADFSCMASLSTLEYMLPIPTKFTPRLAEYLENCQNLSYYQVANQDGLDQLGKILQERVIRSSNNSDSKSYMRTV